MSLSTLYIKNLLKRAAEGKVHPGEITKLPTFIDQTFGDADGVFEISDMIDTGVTIVSETVEKIGEVADFFWNIISN